MFQMNTFDNSSSLVSAAYIYFRCKDYIKSQQFFEKIASLTERNCFKYNIELCKKYMDKDIRDNVKRYTVVSACYNVESYLDVFLNSLVSQSFDFTKNISCIMVDDGSTDNTANIIKKWREKYPQNIIYLHKENGGQASARNLGLQYVKSPYVTFTDPDDFLDKDYFHNIDNFILKTKLPICLVSTYIVSYNESQDKYSNVHPLNFKFKSDENICRVSDIDTRIQMSASSSVMLTQLLKESNIYFSEDIKPTFEDAHLINVYLLKNDNCYISYLKSAVYYYRKREIKNSTLNNASNDKRLFYDVLKYGCLPLLQLNESKKHKFIEFVILYHLIWIIKYIINRPELVSFLSETEQQQFLSLTDQCIQRVRSKTIMQFNFAGMFFYYKVGIFNCFRNEDVQDEYQQIIYVERYDEFKDEVYIRYFTGKVGYEVFHIDGKDTIPTHIKTQRDTFIDRTFVLVRHIWLPLERRTGNLSCYINGKETIITFQRKQYNSVGVDSIRDFFVKPGNIDDIDKKPWIFIDREIQADDNAEHLYRYIMKFDPKRKKQIYFVLNRDAHDWSRLKKEGFQLLAYGSKEHEDVLRKSHKVISSHIDGYITDYFRDQSDHERQMVWLQHGVIVHDLSLWLNTKRRIDIFATCSTGEYESIAGNYNKYKFTDKEVKLIGLPRHDKLLEPCQQEKVILVMPTWRNYIMGTHISGNIREKNPDFMQTKYAQSWNSLLNSVGLYNLSEKYGYQVVFFPHSNIQPYLDEFSLPEYILVQHHTDGSIQEWFKKSTLMITDYSSTAFEMAILCKSVLYYFFDEDEFFSGQHASQKGYFDYRRDGFGPVVTNQETLLSTLETMLDRNGKPEEKYLQRMQNTFPMSVRDGKSCERAYQAMLNLDKPNPEGYINRDILYEYTKAALVHDNIDLAEQRLDKLSQLDKDEKILAMKELCSFCRLVQKQEKDQAESIYKLLPEFDDIELNQKKESIWTAFLQEE